MRYSELFPNNGYWNKNIDFADLNRCGIVLPACSYVVWQKGVLKWLNNIWIVVALIFDKLFILTKILKNRKHKYNQLNLK